MTTKNIIPLETQAQRQAWAAYRRACHADQLNAKGDADCLRIVNGAQRPATAATTAPKQTKGKYEGKRLDKSKGKRWARVKRFIWGQQLFGVWIGGLCVGCAWHLTVGLAGGAIVCAVLAWLGLVALEVLR